MNIDERIDIVHNMLDLCRDEKLSINQRKKILEIVINSDRTQKQKERFIKYYYLDVNSKNKYNFAKLGRENSCSGVAIKESLQSVITKTLLNEKITKLLVEILKGE